MPIHNVNASMCNLAKGWLTSLDEASIETKIPTATLKLLLETLISLTTPDAAFKVEESGMRSIMGAMAAINEAERTRDGA